MAAPTNPCDVKILLANSKPSTHGTTLTSYRAGWNSAYGGILLQNSARGG